MRTALKLLLTVSTGFALVLLAGSWYVFMAGSPQLDPPAINGPNSGMTFQLESFPSQAMAAVRQYGVILPPGYNDADSKDGKGRRYPVIVLLHGGHDDARAWYSKIGIIPVLHDLYQQQKLPLSIVIMADGNDRRSSSPLFDPDYYDGPNGNVGTLIGSELPKVVSARYRALQGPQYWVSAAFPAEAGAPSTSACAILTNTTCFSAKSAISLTAVAPPTAPRF